MSRKRLPDTRQAVTKKFKVGDMRLYATAGFYEDGRLGEVFIKADRKGSFATGALDAWAICLSLGLQHGVPLEVYTTKLRGMRFEPDGLTGDPKFPMCSSVIDLVARWLQEVKP